jgi:hypothetical protein
MQHQRVEEKKRESLHDMPQLRKCLTFRAYYSDPILQKKYFIKRLQVNEHFQVMQFFNLNKTLQYSYVYIRI